MKKSIIYLFILSLAFTSCKETKESKELIYLNEKQEVTIPKDLKWSERMALSVMERHPESYQIDHKTEPKWDYVHGLVLSGFEHLYEKTNDKKYYDYVKSYADILIDAQGHIATYDIEKYNIDMIEAGKLLFDLYDITKEEKYLIAMQTLKKQLEAQPRTSEGGFWHKKIYPYQMWLDGLYMGAPFYAQYTVEFENGKNLDDVAKQFELIQKHALDPKTGLLYHGWDESKMMDWADKEKGTSPNFWSRALGWYAMALVDVLNYFPEDHPKRLELITYLNDLAVALTKYQDNSGLWYQVTDGGDKEGNYLEASGTSMFVYALAKGVNQGYLPSEFKAIAKKGFDGMIRDLIITAPDGQITLTQVCQVAGLGGNPYRSGSFEYYVNERKKDNDPKGVGPFILAAIELDK
ncbi:glycoside hydrolase family 88 protein [uncultured Formosa sp.]|uniref:glycoside hydrolase family 88/105 protein n=1 Tax=uncultured Formosa sp. TaxID=255435 RepID=UPI002621F8EF|nr:glycoside hydrolase family 88 protein [uncultured Formosa sp.]